MVSRERDQGPELTVREVVEASWANAHYLVRHSPATAGLPGGALPLACQRVLNMLHRHPYLSKNGAQWVANDVVATLRHEVRNGIVNVEHLHK